MRTSQGRNFYCVDKERLTPTCDTNYEKSCKFTLYPGTETPYTYEEFCLPNWEYKPYCELDSKSSKLKTFMEVYQEEIKKLIPLKFGSQRAEVTIGVKQLKELSSPMFLLLDYKELQSVFTIILTQTMMKTLHINISWNNSIKIVIIYNFSIVYLFNKII